MRLHKRIFLFALFILLSVLCFMPKSLIKGDVILQNIAYESTASQNTGNFPVSDSAKQELLAYLKTCKIYGTLYPPASGSSEDYLYIGLHTGTHFIDIHFFHADCYVLIGERPFVYHFTNADKVRQNVFDILGLPKSSASIIR